MRRVIESFQIDNKRLKVKLPSILDHFHNSAEIPDLLNANTEKHYNDSTSSNLSQTSSKFKI